MDYMVTLYYLFSSINIKMFQKIVYFKKTKEYNLVNVVCTFVFKRNLSILVSDRIDYWKRNG